MIEELYEAYHKDVYIYIYSLCHDASLSEDLTSETFYQMILSLPTFKGKASLKTWLFSIARHVTFKELRKRKKEVHYDVSVSYTHLDVYKRQTAMGTISCGMSAAGRITRERR